MGWCRLRIAGVEHCGLCGIAHLGHSRTCPHLNDETQVGRLLQTLKESPEPREHVEAATKYLRMIRGDLVQRKRRKMEQDQNRLMQQVAEQRLGEQQPRPGLPDPAAVHQTNGYHHAPNGMLDGLRAVGESVRAVSVALQGNLP